MVLTPPPMSFRAFCSTPVADEHFLCRCPVPGPVGKSSCQPSVLTGSVPSGIQVCECCMHGGGGTGQGCRDLAAKSRCPFPSTLPREIRSHVSRWDKPAPLLTSQGSVLPCPCPSHPACQECAARWVGCRERGNRAGRVSDAPSVPLPPASWGCLLPAPLAGTCGSACPFMCEEREKSRLVIFSGGLNTNQSHSEL